jgi:hypothetical protein
LPIGEAVGSENARKAAAGGQELLLHRIVAEHVDHLLAHRGAGGNDETLAFGGVHLAGGGVEFGAKRVGAALVEAETRP